MDRIPVTTNEGQLREIEEHEAWLRSICEPDASPPTDALKERVRTELAASWLDRQLSPEDAARAAQRAKAAIRIELTRRHRRRLQRGLFAIGTTGLGLAAAWALLWLSPFGSSPKTGSHLSPFTYATAFEQFTGNEFDAALNDVAGEADELDQETAFVFDESMGAEFYGVDPGDG